MYVVDINYMFVEWDKVDDWSVTTHIKSERKNSHERTTTTTSCEEWSV